MAQPDTSRMEPSQIQFRTYTFHFLFYGAQGCLIPFLTIYFRILGLTATQVGIIMGVGAWVTMFGSTCWAHCAVRCNKKRVIMIGSALILLLSYLSMSLLPTRLNQTEAIRFCNKTYNHSQAELNVTEALFATTQPLPQPSTVVTDLTTPTLTTTITTATTTTTTAAATTTVTPTTTTTTPALTTVPTTIEEAVSSKPTTREARNSEVDSLLDGLSEDELELLNEYLESLGLSSIDDLSPEDMDNLLAVLTEEDESEANSKKGHKGHHGKNRNQRDTGEDKSKKNQTEEIPEQIENMEITETEPEETNAEIPETGPEKTDSEPGTILDSVQHRWRLLQEQLKQLQKQLFAAVLVIVIVVSLFGSPLEKLADDVWFELLDCTDMLERYGQQKAWAMMGLIFFPVITTALVAHTPCVLPGDILNVKIHFFMYLGLMFVIFILTFVYPIYNDRKKVQRKHHLARGFRILFSNCHTVNYTLTIMLLGALEAVLSNYLFWLVQNTNGSHMVMGACIGVSAISSLLMHLGQKWFVKKLTYPGAVVLGLILLGGRLVFYSFNQSPWMFLIGEAFHGLSVTLLWAAITMNPDFRLNPFVMDRSALTVTNILHTGIGFAGGSLVSGFLIDMFDFAIVFQGAAAGAVVWSVLFVVVGRCVPVKAKVRYAKLLQDDQSGSEEDESYDENDWLEIALKHQK